MNLIGLLFRFIRNAISLAIISTIVLACLYIGYKGNQPMSIAQAPKGMTYFEYIQDRADAAKELKPARCGVGMFASLAILAPFYSTLYTCVGIHMESFVAKVTAPNPYIARKVAGVSWMEIQGIWWKTVERFTWTMLKPSSIGCRFRPGKLVDKGISNRAIFVQVSLIREPQWLFEVPSQCEIAGHTETTDPGPDLSVARTASVPHAKAARRSGSCCGSGRKWYAQGNRSSHRCRLAFLPLSPQAKIVRASRNRLLNHAL